MTYLKRRFSLIMHLSSQRYLSPLSSDMSALHQCGHWCSSHRLPCLTGPECLAGVFGPSWASEWVLLPAYKTDPQEAATRAFWTPAGAYPYHTVAAAAQVVFWKHWQLKQEVHFLLSCVWKGLGSSGFTEWMKKKHWLGKKHWSSQFQSFLVFLSRHSFTVKPLIWRAMFLLCWHAKSFSSQKTEKASNINLLFRSRNCITTVSL